MQAKKDEARIVLSFKIKPALKERLQRLATEERRTLSGFIEIVLADYADKAEADAQSESRAGGQDQEETSKSDEQTSPPEKKPRKRPAK